MHKLEQLLRKSIEFGFWLPDEEKLIDDELLHIETVIQPKTQYIEFIEEFNKFRKTKYKPTVESRRLFYENVAMYSNSDRLTALKNAFTNPWIVDHSGVVTPEWILKSENINQYLNYVAPSTHIGNNGKETNVPKREAVA